MTTIAQQVSRAIRILRGNRDESARASHLVVEKDLLMTYETDFLGQAEKEKYSQSTFFERKIMSTKTAFKRVALVAAAALAIGGISAVSAYASVVAPVVTLGSSTGVVGGYDSVSIAIDASETAKILNVASTGVGTLISPSLAATAHTASTANATTVGFSIWGAHTGTDVIGSSVNEALGTTNGGAGYSLALSAYSATAGTQTITITNSGGGTVTSTITWGAAPVLSTQYTTSGMSAGTAAVTQGTNATVVAASTAQSAAANRAATIVVAPSNSNNVALGSETLTATISGPGTLGIATTAAAAASTGRALTGAAGAYTVDVYGDGTAGVSTITITDGSTVLATKTVTFYGSPAKVTVTQNLFVAKAGAQLGQLGNDKALTGATVTALAGAAAGAGTAGTGTAAFTASVVDSNGNAAAGATVKAVSSNTAVITTSTPVEETTDAPGTWQVAVSGAAGALSGQSATVTFEVYDAATSAYDILATPITFTIGGAVASETLSTDTTSYNALAPVKLTVTAKDSAGNAAYDQDGTLVSSLLSTVQLGGTLASPTKLVHGVGSVTGLYAPSVAGDFTISGTDNVSSAGESVTPVTATSLGGSADSAANAATDAANEATDAANAATDAANAAADSADAATQAAQDASDQAAAALAAVTALSQQVTDLSAKIAALGASLAKITATLAKVASKVKA